MKINAFHGWAFTEGSREGLKNCTIISDEADPELIIRIMKDIEEDRLLRLFIVEDMEDLRESIEKGEETHFIGDDYLIDLTEWYVTE